MKASEQKAAAKAFAEKWDGVGDEKQHTQTFWLELLHEVYGVEQPFGFITFEDTVKLGHVSFIDATIPETHVMIEQKGLGKDLSKPIRQSDGTLLTPYQQAKRYAAELPYSKRPRWIVACNFAEFRVYDMENPQSEPEIILLSDLPKEYYRLQFLVNAADRNIKKEMELSLAAGEIVGRLYDALRKQYKEPDSEESQKSLNKLCVRLVFCLYAEDAAIFGKRNMFHDYLMGFRDKNIRKALIDLFETLSTPMEERDPYMDAELSAFPYVNGGLFEDSRADLQRQIPQLTDEILALLLKNASADFDWSGISPTIFGAVFESTLNPETRRKGGMHYTSIPNIHKVIDPLFLDGLKREFEDVKSVKTAKLRKQKLSDFQQKLASLTFLDSSCGSGNFLTESYISLRRLENEVISEIQNGEISFGFEGEHNPIKVSISQFYGIEINDFAVTVAKTALWIAESQAMQETENIIHLNLDFLPLKSYSNIVEGNALRMDWNDVVPKEKLNYIMGNPPFVGFYLQSAEQKNDILSVYVDEDGKAYSKAGKIDYAAGWYFKAAQFMLGTPIKTALVSTNSVTQGEQVADIWEPLYKRFHIQIIFAHRTFRWDSESTDKAHVHCVIIGFESGNETHSKQLYSGSNVQIVDNITPYLTASDTTFIKARSKVISNVPEIAKGFQATDNGYLILDEEERNDLLKREPDAARWIRPYSMGFEFINRVPRYCLWLVGITPKELNQLPQIKQRVTDCHNWRNSAKPTGDAYKLRDMPHLFRPCKQYKDAPYIAIPQVSSERRRYIPMGFIQNGMIPGNNLFTVFDATLYHFGVLTSNVHMAWMRAVAGRLKSDYRYSKDIVYNNFPWPDASDAQKSQIEQTARGILEARAKFSESSLADLYDDISMPPELRKAHQANDKAVMLAYGFDVGSMTEAGCVAELMKMYRTLAEQTAKA